MLGYFVPVALWRSRNQETNLAVMDFGPMSRWFELLPGATPQILEQGEVVRLAVRGRRTGFASGYRFLEFRDWDRTGRFAERPLSRFNRMFSLANETVHPPARLRVLWVTRDYKPDFFDQNPRRRYGKSKRDIPNINELVDELRDLVDLEVVDGALEAPATLVEKCQNSDVLIGQHGAGLANAIFLPPGAQVIEIGVSAGPEPFSIHYRELCKALGLRWTWWGMQSDWFAPINSEDWSSAVRALAETHRPN